VCAYPESGGHACDGIAPVSPCTYSHPYTLTPVHTGPSLQPHPQHQKTKTKTHTHNTHKRQTHKHHTGFLEKAGGIFKSQTSSSSPSAFTVKRLSASTELSTTDVAGEEAAAGTDVASSDSQAASSSWMDRLREKVESLKEEK
jgi:hypothetical protein